MSKTELIDSFNLQVIPDINFLIVLVNFMFCVAMAFLIKRIYIKYSVSLTGKNHIAVIIPALSAIVFLVIMIVKSSLALSLGLVGALSIVRFRTPIKEPEELVYLFFAISIGLGYAAGHTFMTTVLGLSIISMIYFFSSNQKMQKINEYNLVVSWKNQNVSINDIFSSVSPFTSSFKWVRSDNVGDESSAVMLVIPKNTSNIDDITQSIKRLDKESETSFYEAKTNW